MEEKEKKQILQNIPNNVLDMAYYATFGQHFTEYVDRAEENGLFYLAQNINPEMKIVECPHRIGPEKLEQKIGDEKKIVTPGDPDFVIADAYIGNQCGCYVGSIEGLKDHIPVGILPYGQIFYFVHVDDCGKPFQELVEDCLCPRLNRNERKREIAKFWKKDMDYKVNYLRFTLAGKLAPGLERRLHIIPVKLKK